ncbi:hypothetical protein ACFQO9_09405 [Chryseobacterium zhengzhouense]|uniref:Uncharacterized protein n=1 Tax=Chryseobacterium zhengzhouense TaxID=1636086 RepID=A0ABW2LYH1_9FLAO
MNDFTKKLQTIFSRTGDSELKNCTYKNGKINLEVLLYDDDILNLEFKTEILYCKNIIQKSPFNIGFLKCVKLSDIIMVENNHYIFTGNFIDMLKAQKNKLSLAFGLNIQKYTHLITFSNDTINVAFIVDEKDVFNYSIIE